MRRGLAQLLPEGHQSIEKRSCKQPDSDARPKHQNVSFSAHCRSVWGVLSLVLLTTGNVGPSSPTKCSANESPQGSRQRLRDSERSSSLVSVTLRNNFAS